MNKLEKGNVKLFIPIVIFVTIAGLLYFIFLNNQKVVNQTESLPSITVSSPTPTIDPAGSGTEPSTLDWTVFEDNEFVYQNKVYSGFSVKYPHTCSRSNSQLSCKFTNGNGIIIINAGGHGGEPMETRVIKNNEDKNYPGGEGKYTLIENVAAKTVFGTYWINKTDKLTQEPIFGFEFKDIPTEDLPEFEQIFDLMLTTLEFKATGSGNVAGLSCPANGWVDCMPGPDKDLANKCSQEADAWYKANCSNYEGMAY